MILQEEENTHNKVISGVPLTVSEPGTGSSKFPDFENEVLSVIFQAGLVGRSCGSFQRGFVPVFSFNYS